MMASEPQPSETGVRDAEARWSEAFVTGDTAALNDLLDPSYVSVSANGKSRSKAEVMELARRYAAIHPGQHATPLPVTSSIRIIGDAAVVLHRNSNDTSVDVLNFQDGRWHAWHSQHTKLERGTSAASH